MQFLQSEKNRMHVHPVEQWAKLVMSGNGREQRAKEECDWAKEAVPSLEKAYKTIQSPKEHLEGPTLESHVLQMLEVLLYINDGRSLLEIEELHGKKEIHADIKLIESIIREHIGTFIVFALLHDVGKLGEVFVEEVKRPSKLTAPFEICKKEKRATGEKEQEMYRKLYKAVEAEMKSGEVEDIMRELYRKHGIELESGKHGKILTGQNAESEFMPLLDRHRITPRDQQYIEFLTCHHELFEKYKEGRGEIIFKKLEAGAEQFGIDEDDARDLLMAAYAVNNVLGRKVLAGEYISVPIERLMSILKEETLYYHHVKERKQKWLQSQERRRVKQGLDEVGTSIEEICQKMQIPFSSEREGFIEGIYKYIKGETKALPGEVMEYPEGVKKQLEEVRRNFE